MSIGRTFKESLQKCLRSLEIGRSGLGGDGKPWRIGTEVYGDRDILPKDVISRKLSVPNAERIFFIRHALRAGFTIDEIFNLTKIDRWFLVQIKEIVDFEEELAALNYEITEELPKLAMIANLRISGVIEPYAQHEEGTLIQAMEIPWRQVVDRLMDDWSLAFKIKPREWEELIAAAFSYANYDEVILTPSSGDHGRDVIAIKKGVGSIRIIDSVKAYKPGNLVRYDDVRALAGVLLGDPKASKGIISTTSDFPSRIGEDPYLAPLMPFRLELMNGSKLREWLADLKDSRRSPSQLLPK